MANIDKIRGLMAEKKISVTTLADRLGVSRQAASNKINGKTGISLNDARVISELLNLTAEERDDIFFLRNVNSQ